MLQGATRCEAPIADPTMSNPVFIGLSPVIQRFSIIAQRAAVLNSTIVITGETGTGKETFARLIHGHSRRAAQPFIPVDCTALPESLFESGLFGHLKGAFTGAHRDSLGYIRSAHRGTLFLDEIGELSLALQAKLLRVLQERCVVPVGATLPQPVDIRVICATNRDLSAMVDTGAFRQDLFYRLAVVSLKVPPLRERVDDIIPLARHWLNKLAETYGEAPKTISTPVSEVLLKHLWPGNIRELFNVIENAHVLCCGPTIELRDLSPRLSAAPNQRHGSSRFDLATLERQAIMEALVHCKFNRTAACELLGLELRKLNRRIETLKIDVPRRSRFGTRRTRRHLSPILQYVD
jgi:two-component system, NtrC family, response regulator PilR